MVLTRYFQKIFLAIGRRFKISSLRGVRKHDVAIHSLKWLTVTLLLLAMTLTPVQAAWFNGDWSSREKITIKASQVNGDLSEFPVYLNLADLPDAFFTTVNGTGADIRMTLADEVTETSFELVEIDTANGTGELWFKAPVLSSTIDTDFYIYYGNPTATAYANGDSYGYNDVWSNGYVAVYHMNEDPSLGTNFLKDSSYLSNHGNGFGGLTNTSLIKSKLGKSIEFDGLDDYIRLKSIGITTNEITYSVWLNGSKTNHYTGILQSRDPVQPIGTGYNTSTNNITYTWNNNSGTTYGWNGPNLKNNTTSFLTTRINPSEAKIKICSSGQCDERINSITHIAQTLNTPFEIARDNCCGPRFFDGSIDEIKISARYRSNNWVSTEYKNQNSPGNFYLISNGQGAGFNPTLWSNKHKITIPASVINGDLENFPVYINLADLPISFFGAVQGSGADIRITKADQETQLAFELVEINPINKTGELWFKADILSSTQDNIFYLWFGNPEAQAYSRSDEFGSENVWTEGYVGVWHMNEDPSQGQILDSTSFRNHGNSLGSMTDSDLISSQLGKSIDFDGNDGISIADNPSLDLGTNNLTVSAWLKNKNNAAAYQTILVKSLGLRSYSLAINSGASLSNLWSQGISSANSTNMSQVIIQNQWEYLVMTRGTTLANTYLNNNSVASLARGAGANTNDNLEIATGGLGFSFFTGELDEIRLSSIARTANWIKTEYLNQKDTGTFYTIDNGDLNNTAWSNLFKITILASQVNGDLTDFPIYVNLADLPSDFFSVVNGTGADIRMTTSDRKTQTAFELVSLDTANGQGELWFKAPFLSSTTDTEFYLLTGNPYAQAYTDDHIFGAQNVWSNGFVAVYHMNEDPNGGSMIFDSTRFLNHGTANASMTSSDLINTKINKGLDFDGVDDNIDIPYKGFRQNELTASMWINFKALTSGYLFDLTTPRTVPHLVNTDEIRWYTTTPYFDTMSLNLAITNWYLFHFTCSSTNNIAAVYSNGNFIDSMNGAGCTATTPSGQFKIGSRFSGISPSNALFDEIKFSNKARSSSWIKTEYNNQNSPSTFYTTEKINRANAVMFGRMF